MKPLALPLLALLLLMTAPLAFGQGDAALPDVGFGANRSTLAYVVGKPDKIATMAGLSGGKFFWEEDIEASLERYDRQRKSLVEDVERASKPQEEGPEDEDTKLAREEELSNLREELAWLDGSIKAQRGILGLIAELRTPIVTATRADLCIVDITTGGPKMYIDLHLAAGQTVNLNSKTISDFITVAEIDLSGIKAYRYRSESLPAPITAFIHHEHLYISMFDEVSDNLARGLMKPAMDGESLAESSRFQKWYNAREEHDLTIWINAFELRRLIESAEGFVPNGMREIVQNINTELGLRHWELFVIGLDHDPIEAVFNATVSIQSRREIESFKTLGGDNNGLELLKMLPASAEVAGFGNLAAPSGIWNAFLPVIKDTMKRVQEENQRRNAESKRDEAIPEERGEGNDEGGNGEERQEGPMEGPSERPDGRGGMENEDPEDARDNFQRFMDEMNRICEPAGMTFEEALKLFSGRAAFASMAPIVSTDAKLARKDVTCLAFESSDPVAADAALAKLVNTLIERKQGRTRLEIKGEEKRFLIDGIWIAFRGNVVFAVISDSDSERTKPIIDGLVEGRYDHDGKKFEPATLGMRFDILGYMKANEARESQRQIRFGRDVEIVPPKPLNDTYPKGLSLALRCDVSPKELKFSLRFTGLFTDGRLILQLFGASVERRHYMIESSLRDAYEKMREIEETQGALPRTADDLVKAGVMRGLLQCPYDSQYEGNPKLYYFPNIDGEWVAGETPSERDGIAIAKANAERDFISYTLATGKGRKLDNMGARILLYQSAPDTFGGRVVLYGNGNVGWIHESFWPQALEHIKADKQIPYSDGEDGDKEDSSEPMPPREGGPGGGEEDEKKEYREEPSKGTENIDTRGDTDQKVALAIVKLYNKGVKLVPSSFAMHAEPKVGQSATYTLTTTSNQSERSTTYSVIHVDNEAKTAVVEMSFEEGYVVALMLSTKSEEGLDGMRVLKGWAGISGGHGFSAKVQPIVEADNKPQEAVIESTTTSEAFSAEVFAKKAYKGTKTTIRYANFPNYDSTTWSSEESWFGGVLKIETKSSTSLLTATSENAEASLSYAPEAFKVAEEKIAEKTE